MLNYNAPIEGRKSSIDGPGSDQMVSFDYLRKALIETRKEQYFMPLANMVNMPRNMGKTIKVSEYIPLLDDRNINDQGINAAGAALTLGVNLMLPVGPIAYVDAYGVADPAKAVAAAQAVNAVTAGLVTVSGSTVTVVTQAVTGASKIAADMIVGLVPGAVITGISGSGNLYGSSKDIGTIVGKIPHLGENGGRKNRVGLNRQTLEGSISQFGFFTEFSEEALNFDSDNMLRDHLSRELMTGAVQLHEAVLQKDLLNSAGVVVYPGAAIADGGVTGESSGTAGAPGYVPNSAVTYSTIMRLDQVLTDNRTPRQTTVINGSLFTDTKVIPSCRIMYVGSELVPLLKGMKDLFGNKAFIEVQHYGAAGSVMPGEVGSVDAFRIVQVPEMLHWAGTGATVGTNPGYRASGGKYNVYPMLVIGEDSFSALGFQSTGKELNLNVYTVMPGREAVSKDDPYGLTGLTSIRWYYGILIKRRHRIGLIKTVAPV